MEEVHHFFLSGGVRTEAVCERQGDSGAAWCGGSPRE